MSKMKFLTSKEVGVHNRLLQLEGHWAGMTRTWFEPGVLADESEMEGQIKPVLDGRFMLHEYKGSLNGKPFLGIAIYGYDLSSGKFQTAWIDSFHMGTAIMLAESERGNDLHQVTGSYSTGEENGEAWGWRTEINLEDNNTLIITAYNVTPQGEESIATETVYKRVNS